MDSNSIIKIDEQYLKIIMNTSVLHNFGYWINDIESLKNKYFNAQPFEHIVIDNFLNNAYAEKIYETFPNLDNSWHEYKNPIEVKYAFDDINSLNEEVKNYFYYLSTTEMINIIKSITMIDDLEYDAYLHGAGVHMHPRHGRLNIHLDYEKHPYSGKERRINIILFLSKDWDPNWNGANELWDKHVSKCITKTEIKFNRAIIFKTNDISWHGLPEKISCPEGIFRKSLAYYYISPLKTNKPIEQYRKKAKFIKRPEDKYDIRMQKLYDIRPYRRITNEDMKLIMPEWNIET
jgi:Rps23 Pro-64 3,4-dihydroxylase Tpa1-like proline 4-hydroxylase